MEIMDCKDFQNITSCMINFCNKIYKVFYDYPEYYWVIDFFKLKVNDFNIKQLLK